MNIILASKSPRRKQLLSLLNISFEICPSTIDENIEHLPPRDFVEELSKQKAIDVSDIYDEGIIIGADTIVVLDDTILGKPKDEADAFNILHMLSGRSHSVYTGLCFVKKDKNTNDLAVHCFSEETKVTFATLTDSEINAYIATGSPMDKAGAYGIQDDWGAVFVKRIDGDYYNVVGFPLHAFYREMNIFEPNFFSQKNEQRV